MPKRTGSPNVRGTKQKRIALGKAIGKANKEIAKENGVSVKTVERQLATPEVKALMRAYADRFEAEISQAYQAAIETIVRNMNCGAPAIELEAVDALIRLLGTTDRASAPALKAQDESSGSAAGTFTLAELHVSLERFSATLHQREP